MRLESVLLSAMVRFLILGIMLYGEMLRLYRHPLSILVIQGTVRQVTRRYDLALWDVEETSVLSIALSSQSDFHFLLALGVSQGETLMS